MSNAPYPETIFDDPKIHWRVDPNNRQSPSIGLRIRDNNPSLVVNTRDPNDSVNNGRIEANMEPKSFYKLLTLMETVATSKEPVEYILECQGHIIRKGQPPGPKQPMSRVKVAQHQDGVCTITVTAGSSRPVIDIPLTDDEYHSFTRNGQPLTMAENTQLSMRSTARMWAQLYSATIGRVGSKPSWMKRNEQQQGGGGGYGNRGGNQGGYNSNNQNRGSGGGYQSNNNQSRGGYQNGGGYGGGDSYNEDDVPL